MIGYIILFIVIICILMFVGREVTCDIRNPRKGQVNEEKLWESIPKIKTRTMYSSYER